MLLATGVGVLLGASLRRNGAAQTVTVPARLQAELLSKLVGYDRNFGKRAAGLAKVALLVDPDDSRSTAAAAAMELALSRVETLGGLPHRDSILAIRSGDELARTVRAERLAVVYVTPGLDAHLGEVGRGLRGVSVLTVAGSPEFVPNGVVIGFEVVSGKPRLSIKLDQARAQFVDFRAEVLRLMKVYE